jgi:hypothetical protein
VRPSRPPCAGCEADATLSRGDRIGALYARVLLARLDVPKEAVQVTLPEPLLQEVREARGARGPRDHRRLRAPGRDHLCRRVAGPQPGCGPRAKALLKANLAKSHSPYYLMSQLGSNARKLGRNDEALAGTPRPSTRAKARPRGCSGARVTSARWWTWRPRMRQTHREDGRPAAGRSPARQRRLRRPQRAQPAARGSKLQAWNAGGKQQRPCLRRLQAQLDGICPKVDAADGQRAACEALLKPAGKKDA